MYAVVDSGTTTTRVRAWRGGEVVWSDQRPAGARNTAIDGNSSAISAALAELLALLESHHGVPSAVICSGMITSNMGLHEVPHLPAPASPDSIAAAIVRVSLDGQVINFIPGVKTAPSGPGFVGFTAGDVMRGEEAEIVGLRLGLGLEGATTFLHIGSHHKAISVAADGSILRSLTSPTGELLQAVLGGTILRSSTVPLDDLSVEMDAALAGAAAARSDGFGRALFLVRVGEQLAGLSRPAMTSYLVGVLASLDLDLVRASGVDGLLVIYGKGVFPGVLASLCRAEGFDVRVVDDEATDLAAAAGAVWLYERSIELRP